MVTGVILNWKRPANVIRILAGWKTHGLVHEAIVWNNNPEGTFRHPWAKVINASHDLGLYTRFAACCLAAHECLLIQDDDLELPADSLRRLQAAWQADSHILHGIFGRNPLPDGAYAQNIKGDAEVSVVLTRVLFAHRRDAASFFQAASRFEEIQRGSRPTGNGEDIIFSYLVMKNSGRRNRVHPLPVAELAAADPIHRRDRQAHRAHRTQLMRACEAWLNEGDPLCPPSPPPTN